MSTTKNFQVGTLSFAVDVSSPKTNMITKVGRLYTKEHRPDVGSQDEKDLIAAITANQYDKYQMITTSVKDVESLQNNLSITKRLQMTYDCWERYDLLDPCMIVFPLSDRPGDLQMEEDAGGKQVVKCRDLFKHHRRLTVAEVAASCRYYQMYVTFPTDGKSADGTSNTTSTFSKEMTWSYNHFRKNVETSLYENVNQEFRLFTPAEQGGPLFLKLLLDQLVVSNEQQLSSLITTTTTYDIKMMSDNEDIIEVIKLLKAITETIVALRDNTESPLPELYNQKLLKVFQTTSVDLFNSTFSRLAEDLNYARLYSRTARATALTARGAKFLPSTVSTGLQLDNTLASTDFLWAFARETYRDFKEDGKWDVATKCKRESSFITDNNAFSRRRCWNCGEIGHGFPECPKPYDADRVNRNRQQYQEEKAKQQGTDSSRRNRGRGRFGPPYKYRAPEPHEQNKRVIDNVPHTYNPTIRRWEKDITPDSGIDNSIVDDRSMSQQPPTVHVAADIKADETASMMTTDATVSQELSRLQLQMAHIQQQLSGLP